MTAQRLNGEIFSALLVGLATGFLAGLTFGIGMWLWNGHRWLVRIQLGRGVET